MFQGHIGFLLRQLEEMKGIIFLIVSIIRTIVGGTTDDLAFTFLDLAVIALYSGIAELRLTSVGVKLAYFVDEHDWSSALLD